MKRYSRIFKLTHFQIFKLCSFALCFILFSSTMTFAQEFSKKLFEKYDNYKEPSITHRRFKHADIQPVIQSLVFEKQQIGESFEGRSISQITLGTGKTKVLLWSQMHGDEATATMAIFDIFRFFNTKGDGFDAEKEAILKNCTLYFVPMLNPDGAERFQRRTATDIDMNRDALRLQTPEGRLLKKLQNELMPEFAFNLHDQNVRYSAGMTKHQATISFLATAYNFPREWNEVRTRSMQVICDMKETLQQFIPNNIAKYSDEHEPRAFGDNIQKWGSSLILIESGGYLDDREKQFIRKLNFTAILSALNSIANRSYTKYKLADYEVIPNNEKYLFDLLIRNASFVKGDKIIKKDIGINLIEKNTAGAKGFYLKSVIEDMGDLSTFWGIKELDATGLLVQPFNSFPELKAQYNIANEYADDTMFEEPANFILTKNGEIAYIIVNGSVVGK